MSTARAITVDALVNKKRKVLPFDGAWLALTGNPELTGSWTIWGGSSSGKTSFSMQLATYLTRFDRVAYNSLEEGDSLSLALAAERAGASQVSRRLMIISEPMEELIERLKKHKSPNIVVIDSLQYTQLTLAKYIELKRKFPKKLFIFVSHADGKEPDGKLAKRVRYDSNVKIFVSGYKALCNSRFLDGQPSEPYTIWAEGAAQIWGTNSTMQENVNP